VQLDWLADADGIPDVSVAGIDPRVGEAIDAPPQNVASPGTKAAVSSAIVAWGAMNVPTPFGWVPLAGSTTSVAWYTAYWTKVTQSKPLTPAPHPDSTTPPLVGPLMLPPPSQ
jgi:hypothetical protein